MGNELTTMETFKQKVVEKVKETFADLITEEQYSVLVKAISEDFVAKELKPLVHAELKQMFVDKIKETMNKEEYSSNWDCKLQTVSSEAVKTIVREVTPEICENLFHGVIYNITERVRSELANGRF